MKKIGSVESFDRLHKTVLEASQIQFEKSHGENPSKSYSLSRHTLSKARKKLSVPN